MDFSHVGLRLDQLWAGLEDIRQAVILVEQSGRIMMMNSTAETLVARQDVLSIGEGGKIALKTRMATRNLHNAIGAAPGCAERMPDIMLHSEADGQRMAISVLPIASGTARPKPVLLLLRDVEVENVSLGPLQQVFGLTPAETRLTGLLANGASLKSAAATLGVSYWTVVTQIKSCYQKTGTHRQAELVSLALRVTARGAAPE